MWVLLTLAMMGVFPPQRASLCRLRIASLRKSEEVIDYQFSYFGPVITLSLAPWDE